MTFSVGDEVVWLYWPRSSGYSYWQRINGVVEKVNKSTITLKVHDRDGQEYLRNVKVDNIMPRAQFERNSTKSDHLHGDGTYPSGEK